MLTQQNIKEHNNLDRYKLNKQVDSRDQHKLNKKVCQKMSPYLTTCDKCSIKFSGCQDVNAISSRARASSNICWANGQSDVADLA
eukprot:5660131-Prorocentrum_lima.AAC.1